MGRKKGDLIKTVEAWTKKIAVRGRRNAALIITEASRIKAVFKVISLFEIKRSNVVAYSYT